LGESVLARPYQEPRKINAGTISDKPARKISILVGRLRGPHGRQIGSLIEFLKYQLFAD
jgi:hypothetical protein